MRKLPFIPIFLMLILGVLISKSLITHPLFALIGVSAVILGLITFLNPQAGIFFLLLAMLLSPELPLGGVRTGVTAQIKTIGIRADDFLIVAIIIGWLTRSIMGGERVILFPDTPFTTPIIVLSLVMILATALGVITGSAKVSTGFFFVLKRIQYFFIFFMVMSNIKSMKEVRIGIILLLVASVIVALVGIAQHFRALGPIKISATVGGAGANVLGASLLIPLFLTIIFFPNYYELPWVRWGLLVVFIVVFACLLFTYSRASYVSLCVGLVSLALFPRDLRLVGLLVLAGLVAVIIGPSILPEHAKEVVYSIKGIFPQAEVVNPSWEARVSSWRQVYPLILARPFLGYGLGSYSLSWTDNQYVTEILGMGVIGLGVFFWLIIQLFRTVYQMYRTTEDKYTKCLSLGLLAIISSFLVHSIACTTFYTIRTMSLFWFLTGLVMVARNIEREEKIISTETVEST